jgi:hypothetical protein
MAREICGEMKERDEAMSRSDLNKEARIIEARSLALAV